jgi:hypothetical protein
VLCLHARPCCILGSWPRAGFDWEGLTRKGLGLGMLRLRAWGRNVLARTLCSLYAAVVPFPGTVTGMSSALVEGPLPACGASMWA